MHQSDPGRRRSARRSRAETPLCPSTRRSFGWILGPRRARRFGHRSPKWHQHAPSRHTAHPPHRPRLWCTRTCKNQQNRTRKPSPRATWRAGFAPLRGTPRERARRFTCSWALSATTRAVPLRWFWTMEMRVWPIQDAKTTPPNCWNVPMPRKTRPSRTLRTTPSCTLSSCAAQ